MSDRALLIVDDEPDLLAGLRRLAEPELNCRVFTATSGREALAVLREHPCSIVLSDIRMPDMDGMELLAAIKTASPETDVLLMTAYGTIDLAVAALRQGACDFVTKPLRHPQLFHSLGRCFERQELIRKNRTLERQLRKHHGATGFIGSSPLLEKALTTMQLVARSQVTVLITGESGTGKELAARTIHALSDRGDREMITVNCAALPEPVLESELFGHRKGAFTGANRDHPGLFTAAEGSTLFLDEIGEMPLDLQAKLLRVLQEREIRPVGDTRTRKIDVRILASTNRDLKTAMREGAFREDLYYRLGEITLTMPPLRAMADDIPLLSRHFLDCFRREQGLADKTLSPESLRALREAPWPGNVRQLQNTIRRAVLLGAGDVITPADLELDPGDTCLCSDTDLDTLSRMQYRQAREEVLKKFSSAYLHRILIRHQGNVTRAARACGMERQSLQHLLKKYQIRAADYRS